MGRFKFSVRYRYSVCFDVTVCGLAGVRYVTIGGELAIAGRALSHRKLVFGGPAWVRTTMQSCASAAKLRGDEPIL